MSTYTRRTQGSVGRLLALMVVLLTCLTPGAAPAGVGTRLFLPMTYQINPVQVTDVAFVGGFRGSGTVMNGTLVQHTALPITDIVVRVRLYDADGRLTGQSQGTTVLPVALPEQPLPVAIGVGSANLLYWRFEVEVIAWQPAPQAPERALSVLSLTLIDTSSSSATFDVVVQNDTATPLTNIKLALWSVPFSPSGPEQTVPGTLAPGEQITVRTFRYYLDPTGAIAIAQGTVVP